VHRAVNTDDFDFLTFCGLQKTTGANMNVLIEDDAE